MPEIVPVILSGGAGTRLWPLSRALHPKQFITGLNGETTSLFAATLTRLRGPRFAAPIVVCNDAHRFLVRAESAAAGIDPAAVVLEPEGRNTAPAIAVASLIAARSNPASVLAVMPSDHVIADTAAFRDAVERAAEIADRGTIVLFGITPTEAHSGYGYILKGEPLENRDGGASVAGFHEKPDLDTARRYLADGRYLWNSGIFVFRADTMLGELARHAADVLAAARDALAGATSDLGFLRLERGACAPTPSLSIDAAVLEKTGSAAVLPLAVGWSDLGSWAALWEKAPRDGNGNVLEGDTLVEDTRNCYIRTDRALVSAVGVENLVIVETPGAVLVADKSRAQDVTRLVQRLKAAGRTEQEQHLRSYRPWGYLEIMSVGPRFRVNLLHVRPGGMLSRQMHHHRSEHWVVVQGTARVTVDGTETLVRENESVYIVATQWHRLENPGKVPLELIEVQIGTYLGEDDIIRSDDIYHRAGDETR